MHTDQGAQLRTSAANAAFIADQWHNNALNARTSSEALAWHNHATRLAEIARDMATDADDLDGVRRLPLVMAGG